MRIIPALVEAALPRPSTDDYPCRVGLLPASATQPPRLASPPASHSAPPPKRDAHEAAAQVHVVAADLAATSAFYQPTPQPRFLEERCASASRKLKHTVSDKCPDSRAAAAVPMPPPSRSLETDAELLDLIAKGKLRFEASDSAPCPPLPRPQAGLLAAALARSSSGEA